jgi:hypothetical protein
VIFIPRGFTIIFTGVWELTLLNTSKCLVGHEMMIIPYQSLVGDMIDSGLTRVSPCLFPPPQFALSWRRFFNKRRKITLDKRLQIYHYFFTHLFHLSHTIGFTYDYISKSSCRVREWVPDRPILTRTSLKSRARINPGRL